MPPTLLEMLYLGEADFLILIFIYLKSGRGGDNEIGKEKERGLSAVAPELNPYLASNGITLRCRFLS